MDYLQEVAGDADVRIRALSIEALAAAANVRHESTMVSAEVQRGALVEERGRPHTHGEAWDYQTAAIETLAQVVNDTSERVANDARDRLLELVHPLAGYGRVWDTLRGIIVSEPMLHEAARKKVVGVLAMYGQHLRAASSPDEPDRRETLEALEHLIGQLPEPNTAEELDLLLDSNPWDFRDDGLVQQVVEVLRTFLGEYDESELWTRLARPISAARELGQALAKLEAEIEPGIVERLVDAHGANPAAIYGYLVARHSQGDSLAIEHFLHSDHATTFGPSAKLEIAALVPPTRAVEELVQQLLQHVSVADGARRVRFFATSETIARRLEDWIERIIDQDDYNALIDWSSMATHGSDQVGSELIPTFVALVKQRVNFPAVGPQAWAWSKLAKFILQGHEVETATLILQLIEGGGLILIGSEEEASILTAALAADPERVWPIVGDFLEGEGWRVSLTTRGWLTKDVDTQPITDWIADSLERARTASSIAGVGDGSAPEPLAAELLARFGDDDVVASNLFATFNSGSWMGPHSALLARKIEQLNGWRSDQSQPRRVRVWAANAVGSLEDSRRSALRREAERA